jgi:hypothetical protein
VEHKTTINSDKLIYERSLGLDEKNTQGMWKIEGKNFHLGGKVNWTQEIRLRNVQYTHA